MKGKRILLGITGGIAAYKIAFLIRLLKKEVAEVKCIMTSASCDFISPLTIATLSENPVSIDFWNRVNGEWNNHVDLALWADVFLIAPLTANSLFKLANGNCDNLLSATFLSAKCPVIVAPAMDLDMYSHATTLSNLTLFKKNGGLVIPAEDGPLASGLVGKGRMAEPENILSYLVGYFSNQNSFSGKKVLITAGPTYEHIDPVRFIGNHSSGKMGYAIAEAFLNQGAEVVLISGPTNLSIAHPNLNYISIVSALDMLDAVEQEWNKCTIGVFCAAVADYRPVNIETQKIKKNEGNLSIELIKNPDILEWAGKNKSQNQFLVGFALETNNAIENAKGKLIRKNLDAIVINTLENEGAGFQYSTNQISILTEESLVSYALKEKEDVAQDILSFIKSNEKI